MSEIPLTRDEVFRRLEKIDAELRELGVARLALFGSVLRDEASVGSDVDLLLEFAPGKKSYTAFISIAELLEARLGRRVDLVTIEALSPFIGPRIVAEAQDVLRAA